MFKFQFNTRTLAYLALLTALLMVFSFTPIGTIPIGPLSITLNIIPIAIAAIALGPIGGLIIGSVFGILSYLQCYGIGVPSGMGQILVGIDPILAFIQRFVPRALDGFLVGVIYQALYRLFKKYDSNLLTFIFGLIVGLLLAAAGAGVIFSGISKNAAALAEYNQALVEYSGAEGAEAPVLTHPGNAFIIFGAVSAAIGLAFAVLSVISMLRKRIDRDSVSPACFIAGFLSAFLNTLFFMTALVVLFGRTEHVQGLMAGRNIFVFIVAFVGVNALVEMIVSTLISGAIGSALYRSRLLPITNKSKKNRG